MKKIKNYLELAGYVEDRPRSNFYLACKHPESGNMFWITYSGREYKAEHMRVYAENAVGLFKFSATTIQKILKWIEECI